MQENSEVNPTEDKSGGGKVIIIAILSIALLGVIAFLVYKNQENNKLEAERIEKEAELKEAYGNLDSISNELNNKILEISQLGGNIDELMEIKTTLEQEKAALRKNSNRQIASLRDRVTGYKEILAAQDKEIIRLKALNDELLTENTGLKQERNVLNQSIATLNSSKSELEEKVALASRLKTEEIKVYGVSKTGKERLGEFRDRQVENLKIDVTIAENKVAPIEGKEILLQVTDPEGNIIFDVSKGSGAFMLSGREVFYTVKKEILYDKKRQQLSMTYTKGSEYEKGLHKVKIYTDSYLMGTSEFLIK